jgi:hypothetical protein
MNGGELILMRPRSKPPIERLRARRNYKSPCPGLAEGMRFEPQRASRECRIDPDVPPPCGFVAAAVDLPMVSPTQRDRELVADLTPERPGLRKPQMVSIRGSSAANQTRMCSDRFDVIPVTNPARLRQG